MLSSGTQRRTLPRHQSKEIKISMNINLLPQLEIEPEPSHDYLNSNIKVKSHILLRIKLHAGYLNMNQFKAALCKSRTV